MKAYCPHCRRETVESINARGKSEATVATGCPGYTPYVGTLDCLAFTAGRRAGLREALKLATDETIGPRDLVARIRAALKAPKVSK